MTLPGPLRLAHLDRPGWQRHSFALVVLLLAVGARKLLGPLASDVAALAPSYVAVCIVAWFAGARAAIWVACAGFAAALWPLDPSGNALVLSRGSGILAAVLYLVAAGLVIRVGQLLGRASRDSESGQPAGAKAADPIERAVAARTAELQRAISDLESFSYTLVHDMRAPLRSIRTFATALPDPDVETLSPRLAANLQQIDAAAERMDRLIVQVLNYSRLTKHPVDIQPIDLDRLIRNVVTAQPAFSSGKADIVIEGPLPRVRGNEVLLDQCFSNLLQNATKFVADGVKPRIRINAACEGPRVQVSVHDNGIGVPPEARERIFEPFQREDPRFEGTGIGLAIVRKAVERLAGSVGVESEPGQGSRFWVELPAPEPSDARMARDAAPVATDQSAVRD